MPLAPAALRRVMREISELDRSPPEGIRLQINEEDMLDVTGLIAGPDETPYAGGYFKVKFNFTEEFPAAPPKCWFATKIFHPNVGPTGEICVNTLKKDWKSTYGIGHILVTVKCLLIYPNPESALDEEAGKLLLEDYESYCSRARLITSVHATPRKKPVEFERPSVVEVEARAEAQASSGSSSSSKTAPEDTKSSSTASSTTVSTSPASSTPSSLNAVASPTLPPTSPSVASTLSSSTTSASITSIPSITRKSASPGPQMALKVVSVEKERHVSPSPLGTADANVAVGTGGGAGGKPSMGVGLGMASGHGGGGSSGGQNGNKATVTGTKAVKRSATGSGVTGAEKRKKALKRL